jgi:hypothetical protein
MRLAVASLLIATSAMAQGIPYVPLAVGVIHTPTLPSLLGGGCTFGRSPNVVADDTGSQYTCIDSGSSDYYQALPSGSLAGAGVDDYVAVWSGGALIDGSVSDNGSAVTVNAVPFNVTDGSGGQVAIQATGAGAGQITYDATGSAPKHTFLDTLAASNTQNTNFEIRRAGGGGGGTYGIGFGLTSAGYATIESTTDGGASAKGFLLKPSAQWTAGATSFEVQDYLGTTSFLKIDARTGNMVHKRNATTVGDYGLEMQTSTGTARLRLNYQQASGASGLHVWSVTDSSAVERSWCGTGSGTCTFYDGAASGLVWNAASAAAWTGAHTNNNATPMTYTVGGVKYGAGANAAYTFETYDRSGTDPTVTWTDAAVGLLPGTRRNFLNQNLGLPPTATGTTWGIYTPVPAQTGGTPAATALFFGNTASTFDTNVDVQTCIGYNTDCGTARFNTSDYSFHDNWEWTYDAVTDGGARSMWIEKNWDYLDATGTYAWRPLNFALDTTANSGQGGAKWQLLPNGLNSGNNRYLELDWPHIGFGRDTATDSYADSALSGFLHQREYTAGSNASAFKAKVRADQTDDWTSNLAFAFRAEMDFNVAAATSSGYLIGFGMLQPSSMGNGSSDVDQVIGVYIPDLGLNRAGFSDGAAIQIDSQTTTNGYEGNIRFSGGGYNTGHIQFASGDTHLWSDSGVLRVKTGGPGGSASDGNALVTGTASTLHGGVFWGVTTATSASFDTGTEVCAAQPGMTTCVTTFDVLGTPIACGTAHVVYDGWQANCR